MINTNSGLSFNDIPKAISLLLKKQESLEEKMQALQQFIILHSVVDHHYPMSVEQASEYSGIPVGTIYEMLAKKELPGCKFGKRWQIYRDELDRAIEAHRVNDVPLSADEQNSQILASHRRKPKSIGRYDGIPSQTQVGKALSHNTVMMPC